MVIHICLRYLVNSTQYIKFSIIYYEEIFSMYVVIVSVHAYRRHGDIFTDACIFVSR